MSTRTQITKTIRGLLKNLGVVVAVGRRQTFSTAVEEAIDGKPALITTIAPLLLA